MILDSVIGAHVEQHEIRGWTSLSSLCNMASLHVKAPNLQWQQACLGWCCLPASILTSHFWCWILVQPQCASELCLMELDPLHCLLGNTTNTANSNLRAQKEHCSSVRSQKSPSFPILGLSRQHLFKPPAVPPFFHYVAQDICKVSAKTLPLIHKGSIWGLSLGNFWNIKLFWTILCCLKKIALHILSISD